VGEVRGTHGSGNGNRPTLTGSNRPCADWFDPVRVGLACEALSVGSADFTHGYSWGVPFGDRQVFACLSSATPRHSNLDLRPAPGADRLRVVGQRLHVFRVDRSALARGVFKSLFRHVRQYKPAEERKCHREDG
jgi:hypothetical protein